MDTQTTTATRTRTPGPNGPSVRLPGETVKAATARLGYAPRSDVTGDHRGSPKDRKIRKLKILGAMPIKRGPRFSWGGDGTTVPCAHGCGTMLTFETMTVDRIDPKGSYNLANVQPACARCNKARGDKIEWRYVPTRDTWGPNSLVNKG